MKVGRDSTFVEFTRNDQEETDDHWLSVSVEKDGFAGFAGEVWVSPKRASEFIQDLELLNQGRVDVAALKNYSSETDSNPLDFEIRKIDSFGHLGVFVTVSRIDFLRQKPEPQTMSVCFELDREFLFQTMKHFTKLFSM